MPTRVALPATPPLLNKPANVSAFYHKEENGYACRPGTHARTMHTNTHIRSITYGGIAGARYARDGPEHVYNMRACVRVRARMFMQEYLNRRFFHM